MDIEELLKIEKARRRIFKDESVLDTNYVLKSPYLEKMKDSLEAFTSL